MEYPCLLIIACLLTFTKHWASLPSFLASGLKIEAPEGDLFLSKVVKLVIKNPGIGPDLPIYVDITSVSTFAV